MSRRIAAALFAAAGALALLARRATASTGTSSSGAESSAALPPLSPLGLASILGPLRPSSVFEDANDGDEPEAEPFVRTLGIQVLSSSAAPPAVRMRANGGQHPKPPPSGIYSRYPLLIDGVVADLNAASAGLDVGLNSWWRGVDEVGEELSQHHLASAVDFQGPDQETMAARLKARGWIILRQSNAGVAYRHIHAQRQPAGYLARLGITRAALREWA